MKNRWKISLYLVMGLVAILVIGVEGVINPFTVWNVLPLLVAGFVMHRSAGKAGSGGSMRQRVSGAAACFAVAVAAAVSLGHLAWLFDWRGTATGSSTSALLFVALPLLALLAGAAAWGVAAVLVRHTG